MSFPRVAELLPHEAPMIVIDEVVAAGEDWLETRTRVTPAHALFEPGEDALPGWALIELMAQTVAAFAGFHDRAAGRPARVGYLLGTRKLDLQRTAIGVDETLRVRAVRDFQEPEGLGSFTCTASDASGVIARARLNVYQTAEGEIPS